MNMLAPQKPSLLQRLHAVMLEVDYIQKEKKTGMRYSIVSHDAVTAKVRPLMVKQGIVYYPCNMVLEQIGNRTQVRMAVRFVNIDDAEDAIIVQTAGFGIDDQDKGPGKAISYAVKYALLKTLGLESGDDPDEDQDTIVRPGIADPARVAAEEFKQKISLTQSLADLEALRAEYKPSLDSLQQTFAAYYHETVLVWKRRASELKTKAAHDAPTTPAT
jgi:hypothetical protein